MIPVVIIAYNQLTYIRNMVYQCLPITDKIIIIDNGSTYQPLIDWYKNEIPRFKSVELIYHSQNSGYIVWQKYIDRFPDEYVITDPDLLFNPEMPTNAISILSDIGKRLDSNIIGLALDISDHNDFTDAKFRGKSIFDWESDVWKTKIQSDPEEVYVAFIDTTFALHYKSNSRKGNSLRVAGRFTCKHIPWYRSEKNPLPISIEENTTYLHGNFTTNWCVANLNFRYDIVKRGDTIIKIDSSDKDANWFNFMKTGYVDGWEQDTFGIIDKFIDSNKVLVDIGAWVGPISLYYANKYHYVYSVEPDKDSVKILRRNIALNNFNNIIVIDKAIYNENKNIYFGPNEYYPIKEMNISVSQVRESKMYESDYKVDGITFRDLIKRYLIDDIGMIKCDIEGGEENIIRDILAYAFDSHIPVLVSFHYDWWKKHKLEDFTDIFRLFYDPSTIINDIKNNPFKSIIFFKKV